MGRPERSVDVESGPVARLACELRALRQAAGAPSYRKLAARANYSATVLSRAAGGRELPSLPVMLAYVTACGGDTAEWEARWQEVAGQLKRGAAARHAADAESADPTERIIEAGRAGTGRPRAVVVKSVIRNMAGNRYQALALVLTMAAVSGWATALAGLGGHDTGRAAAGAAAGNATADISQGATIPPADLSDGNDPRCVRRQPAMSGSVQQDCRTPRTALITGATVAVRA